MSGKSRGSVEEMKTQLPNYRKTTAELLLLITAVIGNTNKSKISLFLFRFRGSYSAYVPFLRAVAERIAEDADYDDKEGDDGAPHGDLDRDTGTPGTVRS